jgi:hypothetical protein
MNERIQELAEQSFNHANDGSITNIKIPKEFIEKFGELIVRECARWLSNREFASPEALKQHFGVE